MANIKHVGRLVSNKRKVIVAYRIIPNDPENALIIDTASLEAEEHDALISATESDAGQSAYELAEALSRSRFPNGSIMLSSLHTRGKLSKVPTNQIEMTPNTQTAVLLSEINLAVAEQKGVTVGDLAIKGATTSPQTTEETVATVNEVPTTNVAAEAQAANLQAPEDGVLTDEQIAAQYRSQADAMFKEAKRLREQAEELSPTKRKKKTDAKQETA